MDKKKLMVIIGMCLAMFSAALAAVPTELSCSQFNSSTVQFCDTLDQVGTGISLMAYKINLGLPSMLISFAIVAGVIGLIAAFIYLIRKVLGNVMGHDGGRFHK
jgi:hypothetical protein